jgi:hypothetical protein
MTWKLGDTSKRYEVGPNGGPGTISSGYGDHGGKSYGLYQFSSVMGTVGQFIEDFNLHHYFKDNVPGSSEFDALWIKMAHDDSTFGEKQHEFVKRKYFIKQHNYLMENNINLTKKGPAVQDMVWSTSVQFGPRTSLIRRALVDFMPVNNTSDEMIVTIVQDYKIRNNEIFFKSSSAKVRKGTLARAKNEKNSLITLAREFTAANDNGVLESLKNIFDAFSEYGSTH